MIPDTKDRLAGEGLSVKNPSPHSPYAVEIDSEGCDHCGAGKTWTVFDPEDVALGTSWSNKAEADEVAELLNAAYALGGAAMFGAHDPDREQQIKNLVQASTALLNILAKGDGDPLGKEASVSAIRKFARLMKAFDRLRAALAPFNTIEKASP